MARSTCPLGATLVVCLFLVVAQLASGQQQAPKPDELKFNGNSGDQQQQDTTIIDNNSRPLNQNQLQPENNFYDDPSAPKPSPLPWPFTPSFGFGVAPPSRGQSLMQQLMGGGPSRLFEQLDRPMRHFDRHMEHMSRSLEQQFRDLERQASMGEGQDVSYFQRNGVAYVRTCTTKRVMPDGQQQQQQDQKDLVPVLPSNNQQEQQQQQPELQNNQQQKFPLDSSNQPSTSSPAPSV